jgi:Ca2+:H+ antiporter
MRMPLWTVLVPAVGLPLAGVALTSPPGRALAIVCALALSAAVIASVHHAEVVAHKVGEPFGTLVLAVSVTVIEVALIVSMMLAGGSDKSGLARDTIFSAIMIVCNGAVGLCVIAGGLKHREQSFRLEGATSALAALIVMATLALVLPVFTTSNPGPELYSPAQLAFAAIASVVLWLVFVFFQTVRNRDYFLPPAGADESVHAPPPSAGLAWASFALLVVALLAVIGLAKALSPAIENAVTSLGLPATVIGIVIALLVLAPETWAALRAARADRLQTSLNLALGSALASIGLTIPTVAILSLALDRPLRLGLSPKDLVLLALTFAVGAITLGTGRTNVLQGAVHLLIFAAFVFLAIVP